MALSIDQVAKLAYQVGFRGDDLAKMVAIAAGESGFDPLAVNRSSGATGLWQILPSAHPEFAGQDLRDPQVNARAARSVFLAAPNPGQITRNKWAAYGGLTYISMYPAARLAATHAEQSTVEGLAESALGAAGQAVPGLSTSLDGINRAIDAWNTVASARFWLRVGLVVAGIGLVIASVNRLAVSGVLGSQTGRAAVAGAKKIVTKGVA